MPAGISASLVQPPALGGPSRAGPRLRARVPTGRQGPTRGPGVHARRCKSRLVAAATLDDYEPEDEDFETPSPEDQKLREELKRRLIARQQNKEPLLPPGTELFSDLQRAAAAYDDADDKPTSPAAPVPAPAPVGPVLVPAGSVSAMLQSAGFTMQDADIREKSKKKREERLFKLASASDEEFASAVAPPAPRPSSPYKPRFSAIDYQIHMNDAGDDDDPDWQRPGSAPGLGAPTGQNPASTVPAGPAFTVAPAGPWPMQAAAIDTAPLSDLRASSSLGLGSQSGDWSSKFRRMVSDVAKPLTRGGGSGAVRASAEGEERASASSADGAQATPPRRASDAPTRAFMPAVAAGSSAWPKNGGDAPGGGDDSVNDGAGGAGGGGGGSRGPGRGGGDDSSDEHWDPEDDMEPEYPGPAWLSDLFLCSFVGILLYQVYKAMQAAEAEEVAKEKARQKEEAAARKGRGLMSKAAAAAAALSGALGGDDEDLDDETVKKRKRRRLIAFTAGGAAVLAATAFLIRRGNKRRKARENSLMAHYYNMGRVSQEAMMYPGGVPAVLPHMLSSGQMSSQQAADLVRAISMQGRGHPMMHHPNGATIANMPKPRRSIGNGEIGRIGHEQLQHQTSSGADGMRMPSSSMGSGFPGFGGVPGTPGAVPHPALALPFTHYHYQPYPAPIYPPDPNDRSLKPRHSIGNGEIHQRAEDPMRREDSLFDIHHGHPHAPSSQDTSGRDGQMYQLMMQRGMPGAASGNGSVRSGNAFGQMPGSGEGSNRGIRPPQAPSRSNSNRGIRPPPAGDASQPSGGDGYPGSNDIRRKLSALSSAQAQRAQAWDNEGASPPSSSGAQYASQSQWSNNDLYRDGSSPREALAHMQQNASQRGGSNAALEALQASRSMNGNGSGSGGGAPQPESKLPSFQGRKQDSVAQNGGRDGDAQEKERPGGSYDQNSLKGVAAAADRAEANASHLSQASLRSSLDWASVPQSQHAQHNRNTTMNSDFVMGEIFDIGRWMDRSMDGGQRLTHYSLTDPGGGREKKENANSVNGSPSGQQNST